MEATAKLRYLRISPQKVRLVADQIRGKKYDKALEILAFLNKRAAPPIEKLIRSAFANAEQKKEEGMNLDTLYIDQIMVDQGPTMKRFMPRAMGRASMILKKTSHIKVVLKLKEIKKKQLNVENKELETANDKSTKETKKEQSKESTKKN